MGMQILKMVCLRKRNFVLTMTSRLRNLQKNRTSYLHIVDLDGGSINLPCGLASSIKEQINKNPNIEIGA